MSLPQHALQVATVRFTPSAAIKTCWRLVVKDFQNPKYERNTTSQNALARILAIYYLFLFLFFFNFYLLSLVLLFLLCISLSFLGILAAYPGLDASSVEVNVRQVLTGLKAVAGIVSLIVLSLALSKLISFSCFIFLFRFVFCFFAFFVATSPIFILYTLLFSSLLPSFQCVFLLHLFISFRPTWWIISSGYSCTHTSKLSDEVERPKNQKKNMESKAKKEKKKGGERKENENQLQDSNRTFSFIFLQFLSAILIRHHSFPLPMLTVKQFAMLQ